jgi:hypothetical protein
MKRAFYAFACCFFFHLSYGQLYIEPASGLHLQKGSYISVQGDVFSRDNITGDGSLHLNGSNQQLDLNGFSLPFVTLLGDKVHLISHASLSLGIDFQKGNLFTNDNMLLLHEDARITGTTDQHFIHTNGVGRVRKEFRNQLNSFTIPVGSERSFRPVVISAKSGNGIGYVEVANRSERNHLATTGDHLKTYWVIHSNNVDGPVNVVAKYNAASDVEGENSSLAGVAAVSGRIVSEKISLNASSSSITASVQRNAELFAMSQKIGSISRPLMYPNPVTTVAYLQLPSDVTDNASLVVMDANGRAVMRVNQMRFKGLGPVAISLSSLANGYYRLKIGQYTIPFVKQ